MKRNRISIAVLFALIVVAGVSFAVKAVLAQQAKVLFDRGHVSPLSAKITYRDGKVRTVMVVSCNIAGKGNYSHIVFGKGEGDAKTTLWLDTIAKIKDTNDKEALFLLKTGKEVTLEWSAGYEPELSLNGEGQEDERLKFRNFKSVEFLKPVRKDKKDNAMFDHWKYSPYTGEKLDKDE